jgi:hypothetical protein
MERVPKLMDELGSKTQVATALDVKCPHASQAMNLLPWSKGGGAMYDARPIAASRAVSKINRLLACWQQPFLSLLS